MNQSLAFGEITILKKKIYVVILFTEVDVQISSTDLHAGQYHIVAADLRNVGELKKKLGECGVDFNLPTCFLTECVLVYMPPEASEALLRWIPEHFKSAFFVNYEQVMLLISIQPRFHLLTSKKHFLVFGYCWLK